MKSDLFGEVISSYSSSEAVEDGYLVLVRNLNPKWTDKIISHITPALLENYKIIGEQSYNTLCIAELLEQSRMIIKRDFDKKFKLFGDAKKAMDTFYSGKVELPSGKKQEVFIAKNETGAFTLMIPSDY